MNASRAVSSILVATVGLLAAGCAATPAQPQVKGPGAELAKQWAKASKQAAEEDKTPLPPEPKLLPATHYSAGTLLEKQGNFGGAIEQYRKAVELNTTFAAAYSRLGLCYTKVGQYDAAIDALKRAADLQPGSPALLNNLGFAYLAKRDYAQAEPYLAKALLAKPDFTRARLNMAIALVQMKRDTEALGHLLAIQPESIACYNLGTMQLAVSRSQDSKVSFERALRLQNDFPAARKGLEESVARLSKAATAPTVEVAAAGPAGGRGAEAKVTTEVAAVVPPASQPAVSTEKVAEPAVAVEPAVVAEAAVAMAPGPATRPIEGVDDEPAIANAPARCDQPAVAVAIDPARDVAVFWPGLESFAVVRPVVFTDDTGLPVCWPISLAAATTVDPVDEAIMQAIVCEMTSRSAEPPASVVDWDLASLRWAAWSDAVGYLDVDIASLSNEGLSMVLSKWLCALNELEAVTPMVYGATAYADDM